MKMVRIVIQLPLSLKNRLDSLRSKGYSASGFVRHLLERGLSQRIERRQRRSKGTNCAR